MNQLILMKEIHPITILLNLQVMFYVLCHWFCVSQPFATLKADSTSCFSSGKCRAKSNKIKNIAIFSRSVWFIFYGFRFMFEKESVE